MRWGGGGSLFLFFFFNANLNFSYFLYWVVWQVLKEENMKIKHLLNTSLLTLCYKCEYKRDCKNISQIKVLSIGHNLPDSDRVEILIGKIILLDSDISHSWDLEINCDGARSTKPRKSDMRPMHRYAHVRITIELPSGLKTSTDLQLRQYSMLHALKVKIGF